MIPRLRVIAVLPVLALAGLAPRPAVAQQAAALDTAFVRYVAAMARQRATQLAVTPAQPENPRIAQQYRDALADLARGAFGDGATTLQAVLQRAPQNPMYRGDLAYAYLRLGQLDPAATEYTRAYQAQQQNGWYLLGIATVRASQRQFADAAGAVDLAAQTDSSVVDSAVASSASGWFEAAGDRTRALAWARISVQKAPGDAVAWFRVAVYLVARNDTTGEGVAAIRRYLALRPGDKRGGIVYANYLLMAGQDDSALALAIDAAQDSSNHAFAAQVLFQAGRTLLSHRQIDRGVEVLNRGKSWADSTQLPTFSLVIGRGQVVQASQALGRFEDSHTCDLAHTADSLASIADTNLRAGFVVDSARTRLLIDSVLAPSKARAQADLRSCTAPGAAGQRGRPARPARPASQPARPRP